MSTINSSLSDNIISKKGIQAFAAEIAALTTFSLDFSGEAQSKGAEVRVPLVANITAGTTENAYETEDSAGATSVAVPLSNYAKATVGLTDKQFAESSTATLELFAEQQGRAVARKIIGTVWGLLLNAAYSQKVTKALASFTSAEVRAMRVLLDKADVPVMDRHAFLNPDYYDKLTGDTTISLASALHYGGTEVVREGIVPKLLGFALHNSNLIPANGENLVGFACHPSALAIAIRPAAPQVGGAYLESKTIKMRDAEGKETGIALGYRRHYSTAQGKHFCTFDAYYGAKEANTAGMVRLVSA